MARDIKVWDIVVRSVHWSMATCVAVAWLVTEGRVHDSAGYVLLALVLLRVVWGFIGSKNARFGNFVRSPIAVWGYSRMLLARNEPRHIGHNPLGGWMILALIFTGLATSISGIAYTTDKFWGVEWVERLHVFFAELLLALVALHIAGVIFTSIRQRENLIASMLHGWKRSTVEKPKV